MSVRRENRRRRERGKRPKPLRHANQYTNLQQSIRKKKNSMLKIYNI
jgi:hypothetical protein